MKFHICFDQPLIFEKIYTSAKQNAYMKKNAYVPNGAKYSRLGQKKFVKERF